MWVSFGERVSFGICGFRIDCFECYDLNIGLGFFCFLTIGIYSFIPLSLSFGLNWIIVYGVWHIASLYLFGIAILLKYEDTGFCLIGNLKL